MTREELLRQEIDTYRRKIALYQAMISEWEAELGVPAGHSAASAQSAETIGKKKDASTGDPLSLITGMIFFTKSQTEAGKAFLDMVGYPLKTAQVLEGIEKGGVTIGGKTPAAKKQNLYTILHRSPDFALVGKDTWGLVGWPGVPKSKPVENGKAAPAGSSGAETEATTGKGGKA